LTEIEKTELPLLIKKAKDIIELEFQPDGYNIGMNYGESAGQTVFHFHYHVIPRYNDDKNDPRGGVTGVIPDRQKY
jgi:diadenosine tetraphosphate (Ap4A) HIT family hydrolase